MRAENIIDSMQNIDIRLILEADPTVKRRINWVKWCSIAACLCLLSGIVAFYATVVFGGARAPGPEPTYYNKLSELHSSLGRDTLYTESAFAEDEEILSISDDGNQLLIRTSNAHYYILHGRTDVNRSYIGGYEEQNLRYCEIGGITVHYSKIFDGSYHSQAKFIYDGDLYVIDVASSEDDQNIIEYIERVLGGIK